MTEDPNFSGTFIEPVEEEGAERELWEFHNVTLTREPGFGFGIGVSGGRDNPHFANGDPSITVSDVLKDGPAEGKLQLNDRIVSANNISLENVEYGTAVMALRECGPTVNLIVKRRVVLPPSNRTTQQVQVTLAKNKKKEDFGITLGCRYFIKDITPGSQVEKLGSLQRGDVILKVNHVTADNLSVKEIRKLMENGRDKLHLLVQREAGPDTVSLPSYSKDCFSPLDAKKNESQNQNLYVQSPTRGGSDILKYNQSRTAPRELSPDHPYELEPGCQVEYPKQCNNPPSSESRMVTFYKGSESNVGIRLTGGTKVGVFVSAIQPGSPAAFQGLVPGDKIIKVNNQELAGMTREEAVKLLQESQDQVNLLVQYKKEEYDDVVANQHGDSFYIKAHFQYNSVQLGELSFSRGQVFHVVDTLHKGTFGAWLVYKMSPSGQRVQRGIIPNQARAEIIHQDQKPSTKKESHESRSRFFKRKSARRSKSLTRDIWEDMTYDSSSSKFPAYERVVFKHPGFVRPVVIYGPLADIARERLLKEQPLKFTSPQLSDDDSAPSIIRLGTIQDLALKGVHCLVDVAPNAVDRLNQARLYPIVIFLKAGNKQQVKDLRASEIRRPGKKQKSSRKLYEQSLKLEKLWSHIFTGTVNLGSTEDFYPHLYETIMGQQQSSIWVAADEAPKPDSDDFLFPMTSRLSYASGPESDAEPSALVKASSDTSLTAREALSECTLPPSKDSAPPSHLKEKETHSTPVKASDSYPTLPLRSVKKSLNYDQTGNPHYMDSYGKVTQLPKSGVGPLIPIHQRSQSQPNPTTSTSLDGGKSHFPLSSSPHKPLSHLPLPIPSNRNLYVSLPITSDQSKLKPPSHLCPTSPPSSFHHSPYVNSPPAHSAPPPSPYVNSPPAHSAPPPSPYVNAFNVTSSHPSYSVSSTSLPPYGNGASTSLSSSSLSSLYANSHAPTSPSHGPPPHPAPIVSPTSSYTPTGPMTSYGSSNYNSSPYVNSSAFQSPPLKPPAYEGENPYGKFVGPPSRSPFSNGSGMATHHNYNKYSSPSKGSNHSQHHSYGPPRTAERKSAPPPLPTKPSRLVDGRPVPPPKPMHRYSLQPPTPPSSKCPPLYESYYQNQEVYQPNGGGAWKHHPPPTILDSKPSGTGKGGGSAFELYKKPTTNGGSNSTSGNGSSISSPTGSNPGSTGSGVSPKVLDCVQGVFDSSGGMLSSEQTGVTMVIPPGALDHPQELYIKVCQEDRLLPPLNTDKGETLLSPLVMCGPHGLTFNKPVQLRLPHRGTSVNPNNWSIALKSSHTSTGEPLEWQNLSVGDQHTSLEDGFISILVKNF